MASDDIRALSDALAADPSSTVFLQLGETLRRRGQLDVALKVATRGAERHQQRPDAHDLLARIAIDMGDFARARAEWEFVLHLSPSDAAAQKGLGFLCFQQGEFEHAALWLAAALAADPSDHSLAAALATVRATIAAGEATADTTGNAASDVSGDNASALPDGAWETAPTVRASAQVSDARALFDAVIGDQPQTVLLIDRDGFVVAGQYVTADGRDLGADLGAQLSGISDEAARAVRHLGLGAWHQIVFESEAASVAMAPSVDGVLLVASPRSVPLGYVRRLLERSLERVGRWLETGT